MFFVADRNPVVFESLNRLRLHMRDRLDLADSSVLALCWVTDFPLFEWNEDEERIEPMHHMFTMPREEDLPLLDTEPLKVIGQLYDLVANGTELASGSIRIHRPDLQQKVFSIVNIPPEEAERRFGAMLEAFRYGAPPHGGIAPGVDRSIMLLRDEPNIREVMAFPKTQGARDEMMGAPNPVTPEQLENCTLRSNPRPERATSNRLEKTLYLRALLRRVLSTPIRSSAPALLLVTIANYALAKLNVPSPSPAGKRAANSGFAGGLYFCAVLLRSARHS
jgi:aspartyl-tRNA synthetase